MYRPALSKLVFRVVGLLVLPILAPATACGAPPEEPKPRPLPEDTQTLSPGTYRSEEFEPSFSFSIGEGSTWVFTIITAVAVVVLARYAVKPAPRAQVIALTLLLGGATTHLIDRLFREPGFARGHVVDFIDYNGWFVGNVADIALVGGAILLVLLSFTPTKQPAA